MTQTETQQDEVRADQVLEYMPLVHIVAHKIHSRLPPQVELDDLISAGVVGLLDAFSKFDADNGAQFRTYAQFRVRGAILDSLRIGDPGSRDTRRKGRELHAAAQRVRSRELREPTEQEVVDELGWTLREYRAVTTELSLLAPANDDPTEDGEAVFDRLTNVPDPRAEDPLTACVRSQEYAVLRSHVASLGETERLVVELYYDEEMSMKEIGELLGTVESRVSQVHAAALDKLRAALGLHTPDGLDDLLEGFEAYLV